MTGDYLIPRHLDLVEDFIVTADGIFRTGGIGIKMCEALATQQQRAIKWDGLEVIVRPRKASTPGRKVR